MKSENKRSEKLKNIKKPKSVHIAMWGYFCMLALVLILLVEVAFSIVAARTFSADAEHRVVIIGKEVSAQLSNDESVIDLVFDRYRREGFTVYLVSSDGEILIPESSPNAPEDEWLLVEMSEIVSASETGAEVTFRYGDRINYTQVVDYGGERCYLLVSYSTVIIKVAVRKMQIYFLLVGLILLFIAFLISYAFSTKVTSGLKNLSDTAVKFAKGDYSVNFTNADFNEMAQLSDTLNIVRDEVKKSEDFQREILANVTHDLKTPLTMIKAYASMIKEISGDNKEKREKHLQVIIDEADRLTGLVNDVLSVSKLSSNIDEINPKVFNLTELVYAIINKFGYLQETAGYSFMIDIDQNLYTRADEAKISQVIYNLLGNAANYTGEDKTVYVSLKLNVEAERIKFSVRDTGKGIPKEDLSEIWNRYYRVKENHNRPVKGTGLGLSIVKAILQNHSFDFGVESETDKGSVFWVDFPRLPPNV